ncbi:MAG: outer membrane beta-barrel protein [Bacteroidota bacterium]
MKHRHSIVLIVLLALLAFSVQAQKLGIRAGFQASSWHEDGSRISGSSAYNSFYVGLFKEKKIIPLLHFGAGLEYLRSGAKLPGDTKQEISYLSIPLYLKVKVGPVFALAGVGANIKVSEKYFAAGTSTSVPDGQKSKALDFPFIMGAGVKILMFTLEARYHWGLVNFDNGASNQYLQLGAAVSF